jgi:hypothetical protein
VNEAKQAQEPQQYSRLSLKQDLVSAACAVLTAAAFIAIVAAAMMVFMGSISEGDGSWQAVGVSYLAFAAAIWGSGSLAGAFSCCMRALLNTCFGLNRSLPAARTAPSDNLPVGGPPAEDRVPAGVSDTSSPQRVQAEFPKPHSPGRHDNCGYGHEPDDDPDDQDDEFDDQISPLEPLEYLSIVITSSKAATDPNLPSTFFPGAGSDRARFIVQGDAKPTWGQISDSLWKWSSDCQLNHYDEETKVGSFVMIDRDAPEVGTVCVLKPFSWGD